MGSNTPLIYQTLVFTDETGFLFTEYQYIDCTFDELHTAAPSESSAELRKQVLAARAIQAKRYAAPGFKGVHCNAQLNAGQVRRICRMTPGAEQLLRSSYDALGLSARAHDRILRVARTVADLAGKTLLDEDSLLEALQYRAQEKLDG